MCMQSTICVVREADVCSRRSLATSSGVPTIGAFGRVGSRFRSSEAGGTGEASGSPSMSAAAVAHFEYHVSR